MTPPLFSIVVPVHDVAGYVGACLGSILTQDVDEIEVIAINDASTDDSGRILDEYAAADPRVSVVHLAVNVGLGGARNLGLDAATGRYVLFVDSDDELVDGILGSIARRLRATGEPDLLLFDFARWDEAGRMRRNPLAAVLAQTPAEVFTASERPEILGLLMVAWNKVYRREFLDRNGFRFPNGFYEDLPWTYPVLIAATRIATLDVVGYKYRQRPGASILGTRDRRHFDVFAQWDLVFTYLDDHPGAPQWRGYLYDRMCRHLLQILLNPERIARELRHQFFADAGAAMRRHRPTGQPLPSGTRGIKLRTMVRGNYAAFMLAQAASSVLRRTGRPHSAQDTPAN